MSKKFDIFISYRRKGGYDMAKLLYDRLRLDGYSVSFDIDTLEKGNFDNELENRVLDCEDFLLVMSPGVFDRFYDPKIDPKSDWVRQEIICALEENKNIVPLVLDGFVFPETPLPGDVRDISRKNAIDLNPKHFEAAYAKMKLAFLVSKPRWTVRYKKFIAALIVVAFFALAGVVMKQQRDAKTGEFDEIFRDLEKYVSQIEAETQRLPANSLRMEEILGNLEKYVSKLETEMKKLPANSVKRDSVSAEINKSRKRIENLKKEVPIATPPIEAAPVESKPKKTAKPSIAEPSAKQPVAAQPPAEQAVKQTAEALPEPPKPPEPPKASPKSPPDSAALLNADTKKRIDDESDDFLKRMRSR
ncbi:MAG: TIR domain-containing protein [Fibromonadales bacterium]|nr:TIR domain-containing protein [Fibromonadales bacterium]